MKLIGKTEGKEVWFASSNTPYNFSDPFDGDEYVCVLLNNDQDISSDEQNKISRQIVNSGCRYAVCAGYDCSSWDDSIDYAYLETDEKYNPPDSTFVMTAWFADASIEYILDFALKYTDFAENRFRRLLIFFIQDNLQLEKETIEKLNKILRP